MKTKLGELFEQYIPVIAQQSQLTLPKLKKVITVNDKFDKNYTALDICRNYYFLQIYANRQISNVYGVRQN